MDAQLLHYVLIGFAAQIVDGALGMAYGVISTSFLLGLGVTPAVASASVHAAEVFTTGVSGLAHYLHRNVDRRLLLQLVIPGMVGGIAGAYLLVSVPGEVMKPVVALYLILMGAVILIRARRPPAPATTEHRAAPLGLAGGFLDAVGGGGWGPVVASTLIARGSAPRYVIGSVNLAEFFVTVSISATFLAAIGLEYGRIVLGLLVGGVVAAPLAGYVVKKMPARLLMVLVALIIIAVSAHTLWRALA